MFNQGMGIMNCGLVKGGILTEWAVPNWYEEYMKQFGFPPTVPPNGDNRFLLLFLTLLLVFGIVLISSSPKWRSP